MHVFVSRMYTYKYFAIKQKLNNICTCVCVFVASITNLARFPYIEKSHINEASGNLFGHSDSSLLWITCNPHAKVGLSVDRHSQVRNVDVCWNTKVPYLPRSLTFLLSLYPPLSSLPPIYLLPLSFSPSRKARRHTCFFIYTRECHYAAVHLLRCIIH